MTWATPRTFVVGEADTAAIFNQYVRDNLNALVPQAATVATSQTTTSATYVDLATVGPAVTVNTLTQAVVFLSCRLANTLANDLAMSGYKVSGATTIAAPATDIQLVLNPDVNSQSGSYTTFGVQVGLTAGSNTFTQQYHVTTGGTGSFINRYILVIPVGA